VARKNARSGEFIRLSSKDVTRFFKLVRSSLSADAVIVLNIAVISHANTITARYFVIDLIITPY
jgi:hypothetical protein